MATIENSGILKKEKKIKRKAKNKNNTQLKYFLYLTLGFILSLTIIYNYAIITQTRMEIDEINREISLLTKEKEDTIVMLESFKNTGLIEENAKTFLGMDYPNANQRNFIEVAYNEDERQIALDNNLGTLNNIFQRTFSLIND